MPRRDDASTRKKKKKPKAPPPRELVRAVRAYEGRVAGCVFTTAKGVTGYYADGPQPKKRAAPDASATPDAAPPPAKKVKVQSEATERAAAADAKKAKKPKAAAAGEASSKKPKAALRPLFTFFPKPSWNTAPAEPTQADTDAALARAVDAVLAARRAGVEDVAAAVAAVVAAVNPRDPPGAAVPRMASQSAAADAAMKLALAGVTSKRPFRALAAVIAYYDEVSGAVAAKCGVADLRMRETTWARFGGRHRPQDDLPLRALWAYSASRKKVAKDTSHAWPWPPVFADPTKRLVVDVGCGFGAACVALAARCDEVNVLGVDPRSGIGSRRRRGGTVDSPRRLQNQPSGLPGPKDYTQAWTARRTRSATARASRRGDG